MEDQSTPKSYRGPLSADELKARISEAMVDIIDGLGRARQRKASLAVQASPISAREAKARRQPSRAERRQSMRVQPLLTTNGRRMDMASAGKIRFTMLDDLLNDEQHAALELWALCEQLLHGRAKTVNLNPSGGEPRLPSPIPDRWLPAVNKHVIIKRRIDALPTIPAVLAAFTAIQNSQDGAKTPAQYGLEIFPRHRNSSFAFFEGVEQAARILVHYHRP